MDLRLRVRDRPAGEQWARPGAGGTLRQRGRRGRVRWRGLGCMVPVLAAAACADQRWDPVPGTEDAVKSSAEARAGRRLHDGAPPTIPHDNFGVDCGSCHDGEGIGVRGLGFAPASPHDDTREAGATQRCRQCHVFVTTQGVFVANAFQGLEQDLRAGSRLYPGAPPTIPHRLLMRDNCSACHAGPAAREEIRTSHPERTRCRQCHVPVTTREEFPGPPGPAGSEASAAPGESRAGGASNTPEATENP